MATEPDFTLYDRFGRLAAIVKVSNTRGTSGEWAAEFRRNLQAHGPSWHAPFFLLVTPARLYVWKEAAQGAEKGAVIAPDYELDPKPFFEPYLAGSGRKLEGISREAFELLVMSWLGELVLHLPDSSRQAPLEDSGLPDAVKDGRITYPAAA